LYKFLTRVTDIIIAAVALIILSPILLITSIVLALTEEHEVIFLQKRVGYKNKPFYIWKFATMLRNSLTIGTGVITLRNDPRVTLVGKFLRLTKINELPQIINVLKGEMSIVGPRPLLEVSFKFYSPEVQKAIYNSRPGITGIGSLIFRDEEKIVSSANDPAEMYGKIYLYKGELELWYQKHASLYNDFMISFLTLWLIFFPGNTLINKTFKDLPETPYTDLFLKRYEI
jgi:lipopolysaccharide/colanic/teichoic acid biosynthesis glycosyltransferase